MVEACIDRRLYIWLHLRNYHNQPTQNQIKTELPDWLQNNNFILNGYRPQLKSYRLCILSWFRLHTETGNIWTHLIAFIASLAYLAYYMSLTIGADFEFETFFILFYFAAAINGSGKVKKNKKCFEFNISSNR